MCFVALQTEYCLQWTKTAFWLFVWLLRGNVIIYSPCGSLDPFQLHQNKYDINGSHSSSLLQQNLTMVCCYHKKPNPQWPRFTVKCGKIQYHKYKL